MQRTSKGEFYTQPLPSRTLKLQRQFNAYLDDCNERRPHHSLNGLALLEFLAKTQGEMRDGAKGNSREEANRMQDESVPEGGESQMC